MDTNTYRHILGLRAIRKYSDQSVRPDDLDQILEAARWTGSAKNRQNWSIIVVDDPHQLDRLASCAPFGGPLSAAPLALALVAEGGAYQFDIGRMSQNIMLAAGAVGLVSCPVTLHYAERAAKVLAIPEDRQCRYAVALGYPSAESRPARMGGRKPLDDLVHHNTYGS